MKSRPIEPCLVPIPDCCVLIGSRRRSCFSLARSPRLRIWLPSTSNTSCLACGASYVILASRYWQMSTIRQRGGVRRVLRTPLPSKRKELCVCSNRQCYRERAGHEHRFRYSLFVNVFARSANHFRRFFSCSLFVSLSCTEWLRRADETFDESTKTSNSVFAC
jgi:hypothetical protein